MNDTNKILACVDQSRFADCVADSASWAARRLGAPLEFLHVLDRHPEIATEGDHSGAIGVDAQEKLLTRLSEDDEGRSKAAREQGRLFLNRLRERAIAAGTQVVDVRQRHGELRETLIEQERGVGLVVLGRRGQSAETTQRDLGRNVEGVVRALRRPILAVTDSFTEPRRAMIAFDGTAVTRRGVEFVAGGALFRGLPVHVLMSGEETPAVRKHLDWARATLEKAGFEAPCSLLPGDAEAVIAREVRAQGIDLLVMGAYSHSPLRSLFRGSKTSDLLRSSKVPALLLR
jgi:nucleotide-binding universal stress UspA family protein